MAKSPSKTAFFKAVTVGDNQPITLPGIGTLYIKTLTLAEQEAFEASMLNDQGKQRDEIDIASLYLTHVVMDEKGEPYFNESDIPKMSKSKSGPLKALFTKSQELNSFNASDIEEVEKN